MATKDTLAKPRPRALPVVTLAAVRKGREGHPARRHGAAARADAIELELYGRAARIASMVDLLRELAQDREAMALVDRAQLRQLSRMIGLAQHEVTSLLR